ncbi:MAG: hypothetical protein AAF629_16820, partial [Chloroflexota bacterium]
MSNNTNTTHITNKENGEITIGDMTNNYAENDVVYGDKIIQTTSEAEPPSPAIVADYLAGVVRWHEMQQEERSAVEERVYGCPFMVKPLSGGASEKLEEVVQQSFEAAWTDEDSGAPTILLLSDPGLGKTEALHMLTRTLATQSLSSYEAMRESETVSDGHIVPIFLNLTDFSPQHGLEPLIQAGINSHLTEARMGVTQVEPFLRTYPCLICFDHLDDLLMRSDWAAIKRVRQFIQLHSKSVGYLIACRTRIYRGQLGAMHTLILNHLPIATVRQIIRESLKDRADDILTNKAIVQAACSRSTLEIILQEQAPSHSRGLAYQRRVRAVLNQSITDAGERELFERVLEEIGYQMHVDYKLVYSEREMMQVINEYMGEWQEDWGWRSVLHTLQATEFLIQNKEREWQFGDRLMQSYFTAAAIVYSPTRLPTILGQTQDHWWQEPLEMLVGLYEDPDDLLFQLVDRDPENAAHCIRFIESYIQKRTFDTIVDSLMFVMHEERSAGRLRMVRLFRRMTEAGHPPSTEVLWLLMSDLVEARWSHKLTESHSWSQC